MSCHDESPHAARSRLLIDRKKTASLSFPHKSNVSIRFLRVLFQGIFYVSQGGFKVLRGIKVLGKMTLLSLFSLLLLLQPAGALVRMNFFVEVGTLQEHPTEFLTSWHTWRRRRYRRLRSVQRDLGAPCENASTSLGGEEPILRRSHTHFSNFFRTLRGVLEEMLGIFLGEKARRYSRDDTDGGANGWVTVC